MSPRRHRRSDPIPGEGLVSQIIAKIKDEPFLFVIAIAVLLIGLAGLALPDLRFFAWIIAALAVLVIVGYYVRAAVASRSGPPSSRAVSDQTPTERSMPSVSQGSTEPPAKSHSETYRIEARNSTVAAGAGASAVHTQYVSPGAAPSDASLPTTERPVLTRELARHEHERNRLQQKLVHATGEERVRLEEAVAAEQRDIDHLRQALDRSGTG